MLTALGILAGLSALSPVLFRTVGRGASMAIAAVVIGLAAWFASHYPQIADSVILEKTGWAGQVGVELAFRLDGLSLIFAVLICGIGGLVLLYAGSYLKGDPGIGRFFATLLAFTTAMLGLVLSDNILLLFAFWELTSITSFLLIGYEYKKSSAKRAAMQALLVTGLGGLSLLAGLILLGIAAGSVGGSPGVNFSLSEILQTDLHGSTYYTPAVILILVGCFSKSAMVPLHFWLPNAMEAPSPVSALLHSSTMVKAGVFLIARLHPALGGVPLWDNTLMIFGGTTMLLAAYLSTRKTYLKPVLAYSTVSSLGILVMLIGMHAYKAAGAYLLAHAMFKASLFLIAGSLTKQTGHKDTEKLTGLRGRMPLSFAAAVLATLSMAGMFPLVGFAGKELILKAGLSHPQWSVPIIVGTMLAATLTVMAAAVAGLKPFLGDTSKATETLEPGKSPKDPGFEQLLGPVLLATLGLIAGVIPGLFAEPMVRGVISSLQGEHYTGEVKLAFWHLMWPVSIALGLSILALIAGIALFIFRYPYRAFTQKAAGLDKFGPEANYDGAIAGLFSIAAWQTKLLQNGSLRIYLRTVLLTTIGVGTVTLIRTDMLPGVLSHGIDSMTVLDVTLVLAIVFSAYASTVLQRRLAVITLLGVIGYIVALVFIFYGAPDVAATQFATETLIVVIFVLVIYHLPQFKQLTGRGARAWDWLVAAGFGLVGTGFALVSLQVEPSSLVSAQHAALSVPKAYGRNIVNVILVDFRAVDTLGEIFVLGVAALGVYTLLRVRANTTEVKS